MRCQDCGATFHGSVAEARAARWGEPSKGWARTLSDPVAADESWVCTSCFLQLLDATMEAMRMYVQRRPQRRHLRLVD